MKYFIFESKTIVNDYKIQLYKIITLVSFLGPDIIDCLEIEFLNYMINNRVKIGLLSANARWTTLG